MPSNTSKMNQVVLRRSSDRQFAVSLPVPLQPPLPTLTISRIAEKNVAPGSHHDLEILVYTFLSQRLGPSNGHLAERLTLLVNSQPFLTKTFHESF